MKLWERLKPEHKEKLTALIVIETDNPDLEWDRDRADELISSFKTKNHVLQLSYMQVIWLNDLLIAENANINYFDIKDLFIEQ
jgi:hypothetical protein